MNRLQADPTVQTATMFLWHSFPKVSRINVVHFETSDAKCSKPRQPSKRALIRAVVGKRWRHLCNS